MTVEEGRALVQKCGVLLLPEWDITNEVVLDTIRRSKNPMFQTEEEAKLALQGLAFSEEWDALVVWSLSLGSKNPVVVEPADLVYNWL